MTKKILKNPKLKTNYLSQFLSHKSEVFDVAIYANFYWHKYKEIVQKIKLNSQIKKCQNMNIYLS